MDLGKLTKEEIDFSVGKTTQSDYWEYLVSATPNKELELGESWKHLRNQINYILINNKFRNALLDSKTISSAACCNVMCQFEKDQNQTEKCKNCSKKY